MKNLALTSILAATIALSGCQGFGQQQTTQQTTPAAVEAAEPLPVVSTGTCVFSSKSGRQSITTTHTDCALRGGNFIPSPAITTPVAPVAPVVPASAANLIDSSGAIVETL